MLVLVLGLLRECVLCDELRINNADEFIEFSKNVSSGARYKGVTVFLNSDIDFTGKAFEPIGNESNYFSGVFNGQGHIISNLKVNSSNKNVGLFGYSEGMTIKNEVMDSTCSITSSIYSTNYVTPHIGGVIGYCTSENNQCIVENIINMGSVTFSGNISFYLYLGGIVGLLSSSARYDSLIRNCANYGSVSHTGLSGVPCIGGIVGYSKEFFAKRIFIQNCLNYGTLINNNARSTSYQYVGGIAGQTSYTSIDNCVSAGEIISNYSLTHIGSIAGWISSSTRISNCYADESIFETLNRNIEITKFNPTTLELDESVSVGNYKGTSLLVLSTLPLITITSAIIPTGSSTKIERQSHLQ